MRIAWPRKAAQGIQSGGQRRRCAEQAERSQHIGDNKARRRDVRGRRRTGGAGMKCGAVAGTKFSLGRVDCSFTYPKVLWSPGSALSREDVVLGSRVRGQQARV